MDLPQHIHFRHLESTSSLVDVAQELLSTPERDRQASFRSPARRESFAMGRYAARTLLSELTGTHPEDVRLEVLEDGSLAVPGSGLNLSISHSGTHAAAAVSPHEVGLDLELIRPRPESLFRFILHPDEMILRDQVDLPQDRQIVLFWTLKEAVLKAKRTGLRLSPKTLRLDVSLENGHATIRGGRDWEARFKIEPDRVVAIAWPTEPGDR